ncbi:MAG: ExeM/NucH family extracellular endonuclease, partial [Acidimicrobiia bacterium]|nr:ExeM/NucH family extracellular endonuclease [Acidimicrobiia bacterium]
YATISLSGIIPNQQSGFGTLDFAQSGIQNGSPDGLALVDAGSTVIEFLSYEGSFTATNGLANGMTSSDIGVSEPSSTSVGESLQLTGTGTMGGDFIWASSQPNTFGSVNTGQAFSDGSAGPVPGDLVITEVIQNPGAVSDANGEWFEIKNVSGTDIDIDGWTISDAGTDSHTIGGALVVPAGGYVVLGRNANTSTNGGVGVDYEYSSFFLGNGADEVVLEDPTSVEFDRIEYDGGAAWPDPTGASMSLDPDSTSVTANNDGSNWCEATSAFGDGDLGTPGADNDVCADPEPETVFIHDVQGSGSSVAIAGQVRVQGIVTALFERDDVLDAFFLQEEDVDAALEGNPATSEGIYVYCRGNCPVVAPGDQVTVTGEAEEFFGMSQIDIAFGSGTATIESSGNPLPTPVAVDLPAAGSTIAEATFENIEGMLVSFEDTLVVSEYFQLARFGQVVLTETARPFQFTHLNSPSVAGYAAFLDDLAKRRIILDDDNNDNNDAISDAAADEAYYYPEGGLSLGNKFRGGDTVDDLTGVLHWSFAGSSGTDAWRVRPIPSEYDYTFTSVNPEPGSPDPVGGSLQVASFNVLNYFTTIDTTSSGTSGDCGPSATLDCRGADSLAELDRQRAKIVAAMDELDADILGLIEIENDDDSSVADLVAGLNAVAGAGVYDYIATGFIGTDAIKVALIYQPDTVSPLGDFAILDSSVDASFNDTKNRPVLAQTFVENATGAVLTVAVNHLKSKGSACSDVGDFDAGDGQGNCNGVRTDAAQALANWLATDPTGSGDSDVLIIGDLNAYAEEDPISALESSGYTDLIEQFQGQGAYSFVFDGQLGYLDHALAKASLLPQVTGVTEWHINADEVNVFDYNDDMRDIPGEASFERETTVGPLYAPDALRSSDHDPLLVGLDMGSRGFKERVQLELSAMLPTGSKQDDKKIETAIDRIEQSLHPDYWQGAALDPKTGNQAFDREHQAVVELEMVSSVDVSAAIDGILEADEQLAVKELIAAILGGGNANRIAQAEANLADAAANIAAGDFAEAVLDYKKAWANAVKAQ